jgi:hypothetical protein
MSTTKSVYWALAVALVAGLGVQFFASKSPQDDDWELWECWPMLVAALCTGTIAYLLLEWKTAEALPRPPTTKATRKTAASMIPPASPTDMSIVHARASELFTPLN